MKPSSSSNQPAPGAVESGPRDHLAGLTEAVMRGMTPERKAMTDDIARMLGAHMRKDQLQIEYYEAKFVAINEAGEIYRRAVEAYKAFKLVTPTYIPPPKQFDLETCLDTYQPGYGHLQADLLDILKVSACPVPADREAQKADSEGNHDEAEKLRREVRMSRQQRARFAAPPKLPSAVVPRGAASQGSDAGVKGIPGEVS